MTQPKNKLRFLIKTFLYAAAFTIAGRNIFAEQFLRSGGGYSASNQIENAGYSTQIYDASNGLPTSDANFICSTRDGYIWIGSYSGIIRYNGTLFERLPSSFGLTNGRGLFEDSHGRLWIGTNDNGVVVLYDGKSRHYTWQDGLPSSSIRVFAEDNMGNIFVGTTSGISYIDPTGRLYTIHDERINSERILRLSSDFNGRIYGHTKNGIIFTIDNCKISQVYTSSELGLETITTLIADPLTPGKVYLGTQNSILYYGYFGKTKDYLFQIDVSPLSNIHWISYDCSRLWVSSTSRLGYLDESNQFHELTDIPVYSSIEMTTSDYQGNLWVASSTQGIMKIVTNNFLNISKEAKLPKETVNTSCLHDGLLYAGTDKGLRIISQKRQSIENELTEFIASSRVRCILEDKNKNLWIATYANSKGLVCQSPDGKITTFTREKGMPGTNVRCLYETRDGKILAGTSTGFAVIKNKEVLASYTSEDGIKNTEILTLCEGDNGEILAGTDGDGIYIINDFCNADSGNKASASSMPRITRLGRNEGLTSDVVMRIKKDSKEDIFWVINSNSLQYIKDGKIRNISSFPYNNNYDMYFNENDEAWILSSYGIYSVKKENLINDSITDYKLFTLANGLPFAITGNSFSALDDDGTLYIAGREGVIRVNINNYIEISSAIKIDLNSIYCDDQKIFANSNGDFILPPSKGRIKLVPSVLDYSMSNQIIRVYLEGYGDEGITMPRNELTSLEYTRLSYGNYILHIQVLDNDKTSVLIDKTFNILKKPSITELFIFRALFLALLVIAAGFVVWRFMKATVISRQYREIRQAKDEAEQANTAKSRFLSNMSQQILTPINTIIGMNEMIVREDPKGVPKSYFMSVANYAFDIKKASESLLTQVNDLLEMTKIESGKLQLLEQEYDVHELLRSIISLIRVKSTEKQLKFDISIDEMIPKRLYGDSGKIKQVILNLLTNAVKYTIEGGFSLKLTMETREDDIAGLCFSVKDTGIGIKQEDVESLFNAYGNPLKNDNTSRLKGSLGLDISRQFAELMGGVLVCQSEWGEGSEFIFTLEQKIIDATPAGHFYEQEEASNKGPYIPQFIAPDADVLIVEDNPMILHVIRSLLKATRVFVTAAENLDDCLALIKSGSFNIVLMDHNIPGPDKEIATEKIHQIAPGLPVYALTDNSSSGEDFYKSKGYNGCLSIPFNTEFLERTIMRHLSEEMMDRPSSGDFYEEMTEIPENLEWINHVEGISVTEGIRTSGGTGSFIFALKLFYETIADNEAYINNAYKNGDLTLYGVKSRIIKTSAAFIGAESLYELSAKLEKACKEKDMIFVAANTEKFLHEYGAFKDKLSRLTQNL